ncbi:ribosome silencing factor [bacterium]|nr:ribosome silencing factor [bacterium]
MLDLRKICDFTDFFIICTGNSGPQARAISEFIREKLKEKNISPLHVEGFSEGDWILMDYVDFIIHIMNPEVREFYKLEKLWKDGKIEKIEDDLLTREK